MLFSDSYYAAPHRPPGTQRPAFSLIELLVVVGVIALLLGILLPALGSARASSRQTASSSNCKTLIDACQAWAATNDGRWPWWDPDEWYPVGWGTRMRTSLPFQADAGLPNMLYEHLPWEEHHRSFLSPGSSKLAEERPPALGSYSYSHSLFTRPDLWSGEVTLQGLNYAEASERYLKPVRVAETIFAAQKAVLWDEEAAFAGPEPARDPTSKVLLIQTPVAFADGHVDLKIPQEAGEAVANPFFPDQPVRKLHHTKDGARGRDY